MIKLIDVRSSVSPSSCFCFWCFHQDFIVLPQNLLLSFCTSKLILFCLKTCFPASFNAYFCCSCHCVQESLTGRKVHAGSPGSSAAPQLSSSVPLVSLSVWPSNAQKRARAENKNEQQNPTCHTHCTPMLSMRLCLLLGHARVLIRLALFLGVERANTHAVGRVCALRATSLWK